MAIKIRYLAGLLAAGAASAIIAAPVAAAAAGDTHLTCSYQSYGNSTCESEGNAQLTSSPPPVQYQPEYPFYDDPIILHHHFGRHR